MSTRLLLVASAALLLLSGCPLREANQAPDVPGPEPADDVRTQPTEAVAADQSRTDHPALRHSRLQDRPVLEPIVAYLEQNQDDENVAGLETADWYSYEDVTEQELTPEQLGEDAMIYKIVEEDAWLSVLVGPPFSEFYLEFRLAPTDDGSFEVIGCELLPELGEE